MAKKNDKSWTVSRDRMNDLEQLVSGLVSLDPNNTRMLPFTLGMSNNYSPQTLNRILLSYSYMSQQIVQTIINVTVDDAIRAGFSFKSVELSDEEKKELYKEMSLPRGGMKGGNTNVGTPESRTVQELTGLESGPSDIDNAVFLRKMVKLFGGGGLIINTEQDYRTQLNIEKIKQGEQLEFIPCDRWELIMQTTNIWDESNPTPFSYYGYPLHKSRVMKINNIEAPSYIRQRLQGWGLSDIEAILPTINQYIKFENLIFELLDEAKVDVYMIKGFNNVLATEQGTEMVMRRIRLAHQMKNSMNSLACDSEDEWKQKSFNFSGFDKLWNEMRRSMACASGLPMNKLYGEAASGMGNGADTMENYYGKVVAEQGALKRVLLLMARLRCKVMFGYIPEDLDIVFPALRILDQVEQEQVNTSKQTRQVELFNLGLVTSEEAMSTLLAEGVILSETETSTGKKKVEPSLGLDPSGKPGKKKDPSNPMGGDKRDKQRKVQKDNREAR